MPGILVVYYSRHGATARLAECIATGIEAVADCQAVVRSLPEVSADNQQTQPVVPEQGPPFATIDDLKDCDGLVLGSPAYFGSMAAEVKHFLDQTTPLWISGALIGKPAAVFTSSSSMHGGQENVLLNLMTPLLHHGMVICGIPYSESALHQTRSGGTPYGASHLAAERPAELTSDESELADALGRRIAGLAARLKP
jgi:NAD(P)H dehydrogenase (quinone)